MTPASEVAYAVALTDGAEQDIESVVDFIASNDSPARAMYVLRQLGDVVDSLSHAPMRCTVLKELAALGIRTFRQDFFKPYRVIYGMNDRRVIIHLVIDGRRDVQAHLEQRLLGA